MEKCPITGRPCNNSKTFEISEIVDGKVRSLMLCGRCAGPYFSDERMSDDIGKNSSAPTMTFEQMLADFVNFATNQKGDKCPSCGATVEQIQKNKRLGCLHCYDFFGDKLNDILSENKKLEKEEKKEKKEEIPACFEDCFKINTIEKYLESLAMDISDAIEYEQYELVADLEKKFDEAKKILDEKTLLQEKLNEAIEENDFDKAKTIKNSIEFLVIKYLASQGF